MNANRTTRAVMAAVLVGQCPLLCYALLPCAAHSHAGIEVEGRHAASEPGRVALLGAGSLQADPDGAGTNPQPASPGIPAVRLASMEGYDDDVAYSRSMAERAADLAEQAEQSTDPSTRASLLMAAANVTLAHELEPICSAALLHLPNDPGDPGEARASAALDRADDWIDRAERTIEGMDPGSEEERTPQRELGRRREVLEAFAQALRAFLVPDGAGEAAGSDRRPAPRLSVVLEDDDPQVVAAATLWQACLRTREPNLDRALAMLDRALADPRGRSMPYAFFGRLLRCRLLAQRGGHAAALALLAQIEDLSTGWMGNDADRADAIRTTALVSTQILADWHDQLRQADEPAGRAWCSNRIEAVRAAHFGGADNTVLRLSPAVPLVALPPEGRGQHIERTQSAP